PSKELEQHPSVPMVRDWSLARTRESLFLFGRHCAPSSCPTMSNGWFKYQLDSRVCTMYSMRQAPSRSSRLQHARYKPARAAAISSIQERFQPPACSGEGPGAAASSKRLAETRRISGPKLAKWQLTASGLGAARLQSGRRDPDYRVLRPGLAGSSSRRSRKTHTLTPCSFATCKMSTRPQTGVCDKLRACGRALAATPNQPHQLAAASAVVAAAAAPLLQPLPAASSANSSSGSGRHGGSADQQSLASLVKKLRLQLECGTGTGPPPDGAVQLTYAYDFDENGLFYWLGTNAGSQPSWVNPVQAGVVVMTTWNGKDLSYEIMLPLNCHTADDATGCGSRLMLELTSCLAPTPYGMPAGSPRSALRNWVLEASHDATNWIVIRPLRDPGSTCTWPIELADLRSATAAHDLETDDGAAAAGCSRGWRYFQIRVTGKNASNQMHVLSCSGLELYGRVTRAHAEVGARHFELGGQPSWLRLGVESGTTRHAEPAGAGSSGCSRPRLVLGLSQDSLGEGTVTKELTGGKVAVRWDAKPDQIRVYADAEKRDNVYDLTLAPSHDEQQLWTSAPQQRAEAAATAAARLLLNEAEKFEDEERWLSEVLDRGDLSLLKNMEDLMMRGSSAGAGRSAVMGVADHLTASDPNLDSDAAATSAGSAAAGSASASAPSSAASTTSRARSSRCSRAAANASSPGDFSDFFQQLCRAAVRSSMRPAQSAPDAAVSCPVSPPDAWQRRSRLQQLGIRFSSCRSRQCRGGVSNSGPPPSVRRLWSHARHRGGGGGGSGGGGGGGGHTGASVGGGGSSEPPPDSTQSFPNLRDSIASETFAEAAVGRRQRRKSGSGSGGSSSAAAAVSGTATTVVLSDSDSDMMQLCCSAHHPDDEFLDYHEDDAYGHRCWPQLQLAWMSILPRRRKLSQPLSAAAAAAEVGRPWDDELIVKRQCPALLPAFDPVPGRTNVNQTQDFHIGDPSPASMDKLMSLMLPQSAAESDNAPSNSTKLVLSVKSVQHTDLELTMQDRSASVFKYIVQAMLEASLRSSATAGSAASRGNGAAISDQLRRVWDTSFTLAYREADAAEGSLIGALLLLLLSKAAERDSTGSEARLLSRSAPSDVGRSPEEMTPAQSRAYTGAACTNRRCWTTLPPLPAKTSWREWRLRGSRRNVMRKNNCRKLISAYRPAAEGPDGFGRVACRASAASTKDGIAATGQRVGAADCGHTRRCGRRSEPAAHFLHGQRCNLLSCSTPRSSLRSSLGKAQEPLMLASLALPDWCESVANYCPILFPFSLRLQLFHCVAFGPTRALMWIQAQKRRAQELQQGQTKRPVREDQLPLGEVSGSGPTEARASSNPRLSGDPLLAWAAQLLDTHAAARKAELEVQFDGEQGTGLGPTLEFFSLLAAEFTRRDLGMWICEDPNADEAEDAVAEDGKPVGYYVTRPSGLFPAPYRTCPPRVAALFRLLGMSLAKCLQDGRLMDTALPGSGAGGQGLSAAWWSGILGSQDFACLYPERASLINRLESEPDRAAVAAELEDLCLDCVWLPTSRVYGETVTPLRRLQEAE
uniref:E3 ubiquitin-protein ligase n=1 Tax=Macrostomum lignano TaxID=282301 RepID=A0A1I8FBX4_9PLAT